MAAEKISGIYEIVNAVDGKRYVGSAVSIRKRWKEHRAALRRGDHANIHLNRAWNKYGEGSFIFRVLEHCDPIRLIEREQYHINVGCDYNICPVAGSTLGREHSEDTRAKIGSARRGKKLQPRSEEHRRSLSAALRGKLKADHVMAALQAGRRAYKLTDEDRKTRSEATRRAYSEGRKERAKSEEHRQRIAESLRGRKASEEARANQSAAQTGKKRGPYNLDPAKAEARREAGRKLAALMRERCRKALEN